jgi:hypothetical protein
MLQELHAKKKAAMLKIRIERIQFKKDLLNHSSIFSSSWSGRVPLHMAFYCHYMVVVGVGKGIWKPLLVNTTSRTVVKRMATSRMYSANGVLS